MANVYHDIDLYGREEAGGKPFELYNEEAIKTALTLWLTSKAGDFLRNPDAGGILDRILFKNMEGPSMSKWLFSLKNALYFQFAPAIVITNLIVDKDYTRRYLRIEITYTLKNNNEVQTLEIYTKDLISIPEQRQQLIYDTEEQIWKWVIYKFSNFSTSDSYYDQILSICNE
jgi:hypothetical protein